MTAQDIRDQKFTRFKRGGYESGEVDAFMRSIEDDYTRLEAQKSDAQSEAARLRVIVHDLETQVAAAKKEAIRAAEETGTAAETCMPVMNTDAHRQLPAQQGNTDPVLAGAAWQAGNTGEAQFAQAQPQQAAWAQLPGGFSDAADGVPLRPVHSPQYAEACSPPAQFCEGYSGQSVQRATAWPAAADHTALEEPVPPRLQPTTPAKWAAGPQPPLDSRTAPEHRALPIPPHDQATPRLPGTAQPAELLPIWSAWKAAIASPAADPLEEECAQGLFERANRWSAKYLSYLARALGASAERMEDCVQKLRWIETEAQDLRAAAADLREQAEFFEAEAAKTCAQEKQIGSANDVNAAKEVQKPRPKKTPTKRTTAAAKRKAAEEEPCGS